MSHKLVLKNENGVKWYSSDLIASNLGARHFFSTRVGGFSQGYYSNLNLGIYTDDERSLVERNFKAVSQSAKMTINKLVYLSQVHGNAFYVVDDNNYNQIVGKEGDALITRTKGITIGIFTADCVPIILIDKDKDVISVVHAGWKGTQLLIVSRVLEYMINTMECNPRSIYASLGPSIGMCCFEVKKDVADLFNCKIQRENKWYVDLWQENINQITKYGILTENIDGGNLCTMCNSELFFSYRRDNGKTGRLGTFIQLI
jgi:polyphenol oxidase